MEAKAQVESGAVDCGESDEEPSREVSHWLPLSPHLMFVVCSHFRLFRVKGMCQTLQMVMLHVCNTCVCL